MADLKRSYLSDEEIYVWVTTNADPTGTAPKWMYVEAGTTATNTSSLVAGSWDSEGWSSATQMAKAWSPTLRTESGLSTTGTYQPYVQVVAGGKTALVKSENQLVLY